MTDLAAWLIDRIADDEAVARAAQAVFGSSGWKILQRQSWGDAVAATETGVPVATGAESVLPHIARWDPARVLAECAAKRRIVKAYEFETDTPPDGTDQPPAMALRLLALPYNDRDGYDPAWTPE